jgi:HAD superfamily hydrolase (TIGR01549 family)
MGVHMYDFIIFDVDGTLIETEQVVIDAYQKVIFEEFGRYFSTEEFFENHSVPTFERMKRFGVKNVEEAVDKFHIYLMEGFCKLKPYEGILQILKILKHKNILTGIVTARSGKEVSEDPCLQSFIKNFEFIVCADDTIKHKPDPEPLLFITKKMKANKAKTIYIGDTYSDYMCAKNSGVHFGLALWGAKDIENIIAHHNFLKPGDIQDVLLR